MVYCKNLTFMSPDVLTAYNISWSPKIPGQYKHSPFLESSQLQVINKRHGESFEDLIFSQNF